MEKYAAIGKVNLKFNLPAPLLLSAALLILSPLFIGIQNLDPLESAKVLEYYLVFLGVILFPPRISSGTEPGDPGSDRLQIYRSLGSLWNPGSGIPGGPYGVVGCLYGSNEKGELSV